MVCPHATLPETSRPALDAPAIAALSWFVLRTNPKCEDRAQASVEAKGFSTFLPTMKRERRHPRTKEWQVRTYPLFSRYMFVGLDHEGQVGIVRRCDGVEQALGVNGRPLRVPGADVARCLLAQASGDFDDVRRASVKRPYRGGDLVLITKGPLTGAFGHVATYRGRQAVELMVRLFGGLTPVVVAVDGTEAA